MPGVRERRSSTSSSLSDSDSLFCESDSDDQRARVLARAAGKKTITAQTNGFAVTSSDNDSVLSEVDIESSDSEDGGDVGFQPKQGGGKGGKGGKALLYAMGGGKGKGGAMQNGGGPKVKNTAAKGKGVKGTKGVKAAKNEKGTAKGKGAKGGKGGKGGKSTLGANGRNSAGSEKGKELYCVCRSEYDGEEFMVACDGCEEWFHGRCVGVTPVIAQEREYFCDNCKASKLGIHSDSDSDTEYGSKPLALIRKSSKRAPKASGKSRKNQTVAIPKQASEDELLDDDICPVCDGECTCNAAPAIPAKAASPPPPTSHPSVSGKSAKVSKNNSIPPAVGVAGGSGKRPIGRPRKDGSRCYVPVTNGGRNRGRSMAMVGEWVVEDKQPKEEDDEEDFSSDDLSGLAPPVSDDSSDDLFASDDEVPYTGLVNGDAEGFDDELDELEEEEEEDGDLADHEEEEDDEDEFGFEEVPVEEEPPPRYEWSSEDEEEEEEDDEDDFFNSPALPPSESPATAVSPTDSDVKMEDTPSTAEPETASPLDPDAVDDINVEALSLTPATPSLEDDPVEDSILAMLDPATPMCPQDIMSNITDSIPIPATLPPPSNGQPTITGPTSVAFDIKKTHIGPDGVVTTTTKSITFQVGAAQQAMLAAGKMIGTKRKG
ncbi:hypothetical protein HK104_010729, partial [Borealophlyctis nickersoniae]